MSVKRYTHHWSSYKPSFMDEQGDGDYVIHSDYATLLARHNALKEALLQIKEYANGQNWKSIVNIVSKVITKEDK